MSDPTECVFVDSDTRYSQNPSMLQTNQPVARQQVNNQGLLSKCRSHHTASTHSRPKTPGIMDQKDSCVGDELGNNGVLTLRCPVQHGTATNWDDARKRVD